MQLHSEFPLTIVACGNPSLIRCLISATDIVITPFSFVLISTVIKLDEVFLNDVFLGHGKDGMWNSGQGWAITQLLI